MLFFKFACFIFAFEKWGFRMHVSTFPVCVVNRKFEYIYSNFLWDVAYTLYKDKDVYKQKETPSLNDSKSENLVTITPASCLT